MVKPTQDWQGERASYPLGAAMLVVSVGTRPTAVMLGPQSKYLVQRQFKNT
jgi:hypothetical protein